MYRFIHDFILLLRFLLFIIHKTNSFSKVKNNIFIIVFDQSSFVVDNTDRICRDVNIYVRTVIQMIHWMLLNKDLIIIERKHTCIFHTFIRSDIRNKDHAHLRE